MNFFFVIFNILIILIKTGEENKKYLEFSFKRNLTLSNTMSPLNLFESLFYNQIFLNLKVGSQQIEIPFYLYLQQYSFIIQSLKVPEDQVKGIYDNTKSKTYSSLAQKESFITMDMSEGILSKDIFNLNNQNFFMDFYLSEKNHYESHINEGGKIGFKFRPESAQSEEAFFIKNLKKNEIISELIFSFKYTSKDEGKLFIGTYPHIIENKFYKPDYFINDNAAQIYSNIEWALYFDEIKINNNIIEKKCDAFLYIEIGYIIGTKNFFDFLFSLEIWKKYFNSNNKCHEARIKINDLEKNDVDQKISDDYIIYYCDKDINVNKINFGQLNFVDKSMNYTFYFTKDDLWEEKNGYKYFKIINHEFNNDYWFLGKPFFEKYQLVFDYDNKKIGVYSQILKNYEINNNSGGKNIFAYIFIILLLILIIIGLVFLLIKAYKNFPKRKIANELLDDNYVYDVKEMNHIN